MLPPVERLTHNYVAPATLSDGTAVVLKLGVPDVGLNPEFGSEIEALRHFDGIGCVRPLALDRSLGAMLLERALPGTALACLDDDEQATRAAARLMCRLSRPIEPGHAFPSVADWGRGFACLRGRFRGESGPLPAELVARATALFGELLATSADPVLLHGDLHHWNILRATREPWLAIDPRGVIGEPAYEVGAVLRNRVGPTSHRGNPVQVLRRRLDILSDELSIDRSRLHRWAFAQAILSAWWDIEDGTGTGDAGVRFANMLQQINA